MEFVKSRMYLERKYKSIVRGGLDRMQVRWIGALWRNPEIPPEPFAAKPAVIF